MNANRTAICVLSLLFATTHAQATKWGLNSFGDSVYWSESIVVAKVRSVDRIDKSKAIGGGIAAKAEITVQILECWKGGIQGEARVRDLDLGDASANASPFPPIPEELAGRLLLLFLFKKDDSGAYRTQNRGIVEDGLVNRLLFHNFRLEKHPMHDLRAMVAELGLVQAVCPLDRHLVKSEPAALAGCQVALHSKYEHVAWYGTRRLLDRTIPSHMLGDLISVAKAQKSSFPLRYLLVQAIARVGEKKAVPDLIDILRTDPKDIYTAKALQQLTGANHGEDAAAWADWWQKNRDR